MRDTMREVSEALAGGLREHNTEDAPTARGNNLYGRTLHDTLHKDR
jgi:hypothetical protein